MRRVCVCVRVLCKRGTRREQGARLFSFWFKKYEISVDDFFLFAQFRGKKDADLSPRTTQKASKSFLSAKSEAAGEEVFVPTSPHRRFPPPPRTHHTHKKHNHVRRHRLFCHAFLSPCPRGQARERKVRQVRILRPFSSPASSLFFRVRKVTKKTQNTQKKPGNSLSRVRPDAAAVCGHRTKTSPASPSVAT